MIYPATQALSLRYSQDASVARSYHSALQSTHRLIHDALAYEAACIDCSLHIHSSSTIPSIVHRAASKSAQYTDLISAMEIFAIRSQTARSQATYQQAILSKQCIGKTREAR